jgi:hypothetical protein
MAGDAAMMRAPDRRNRHALASSSG